MFISHKYKVIFVHIQRTGGSSIYRAFEESDPDIQHKLPFDPEKKRLKHPFTRDIKAVMDKSLFQDYTKFCVVRNPFDRMVSWYSMFKHNTLEKITFDHPELETLGDAIESTIAKNVSTFEDFIKLPKDDPDGFFVRFHTPQKTFITDHADKIMVDKILHFENLTEEFNKFADDVGFDGQLPHINSSIRERHYREYYTDEMKQEMLNRFKEDFDYFGYKF